MIIPTNGCIGIDHFEKYSTYILSKREPESEWGQAVSIYANAVLHAFTFLVLAYFPRMHLPPSSWYLGILVSWYLPHLTLLSLTANHQPPTATRVY